MKKLGAYKPGQDRPSEEDFKAGCKETITKDFFKLFIKKVIINCLILRLSIHGNSIVNKFTVCMKSVFIFGSLKSYESRIH